MTDQPTPHGLRAFPHIRLRTFPHLRLRSFPHLRLMPPVPPFMPVPGVRYQQPALPMARPLPFPAPAAPDREPDAS